MPFWKPSNSWHYYPNKAITSGTKSLTMPKLKLMEEGLANLYWLVNTRTNSSFMKQQGKIFLSQSSPKVTRAFVGSWILWIYEFFGFIYSMNFMDLFILWILWIYLFFMDLWIFWFLFVFVYYFVLCFFFHNIIERASGVHLFCRQSPI